VAGSAERIAEDVRRIAAGVAKHLSLEVVDVVFRRQGRHSLLRIDIDRAGVPGVSLEDCERASREIEREVDAAGLIQDSYDLQVSSPGIDRPIATDDDIRRNAGRRVVVETSESLEGVRVFRGVLRGSEGDGLRITDESDREVLVPRRFVMLARQDVEADLHVAEKERRPRKKRERRGIFGESSS
jgi:ribosome maturation factor RimP